MAYDEGLAERVRDALADRDDVSERRMFGGLEAAEEALGRPHVRPMDFTGRPLRGFVTVGDAGLRGPGLSEWVERSVAFAASLPPKQRSRR